MLASGRCGGGTSHYGCLRVTSSNQEPGQDGEEAGCHCHPTHGRAVSQQVYLGVPCLGPSQARTIGGVHQTVRA